MILRIKHEASKRAGKKTGRQARKQATNEAVSRSLYFVKELWPREVQLEQKLWVEHVNMVNRAGSSLALLTTWADVRSVHTSRGRLALTRAQVDREMCEGGGGAYRSREVWAVVTIYTSSTGDTANRNWMSKMLTKIPLYFSINIYIPHSQSSIIFVSHQQYSNITMYAYNNITPSAEHPNINYCNRIVEPSLLSTNNCVPSQSMAATNNYASKSLEAPVAPVSMHTYPPAAQYGLGLNQSTVHHKAPLVSQTRAPMSNRLNLDFLAEHIISPDKWDSMLSSEYVEKPDPATFLIPGPRYLQQLKNKCQGKENKMDTCRTPASGTCVAPASDRGVSGMALSDTQSSTGCNLEDVLSALSADSIVPSLSSQSWSYPPLPLSAVTTHPPDLSLDSVLRFDIPTTTYEDSIQLSLPTSLGNLEHCAMKSSLGLSDCNEALDNKALDSGRKRKRDASDYFTNRDSDNSSSGIYSDDNISALFDDTNAGPGLKRSRSENGTWQETSQTSQPTSPKQDVTSHDQIEASTSTDQGTDKSEGDTKKPNESYISLIAKAILSCPEKRIVLGDIYQYVSDNFPYYRESDPAWKNSIRHNLSINECFVKSGRAASGRGYYWAIHAACFEDFKKGDFNRRQARRRVQNSYRQLLRATPYMHNIPGLPTATTATPLTSTPTRSYPTHYQWPWAAAAQQCERLAGPSSAVLNNRVEHPLTNTLSPIPASAAGHHQQQMMFTSPQYQYYSSHHTQGNTSQIQPAFVNAQLPQYNTMTSRQEQPFHLSNIHATH